MKKLLIILLFIPLISFGQTWKVETRNDAFIGKSSVAYGIGSGGDFPYKNPVICFRKSQESGKEAFIMRVGGLGCDNPTITFAFNGEYNDKLKFNLNPSDDNDYGFFDTGNYKFYTLVKKLKSSNYAEVLVESDCASNRFTIKLDGSTKAINKVWEN